MSCVMSARLAETWTLESFLAWEEEQEFKHEFDGFEPVAMAGGTDAHSGLQVNLAVAVGSRLRGRQCRFRNSDLKIRTALGTARYPDGMVIRSAPDPRATIVDDPTVVFEVLSDSSQGTDRIAKMAEYRATLSIQSYVMLEQQHVQATVFSRTGDGQWLGRVLRAGEVLALPEIDVEFLLDELYDGIIPADRPAPAP
jgi:Uma2 family endonuclease